MLQKFKVNNYKNFKDDIEIDFSNNLEKRFFVYGKNGSGKTNLGYALYDLKNTLAYSYKKDELISNANSDNGITTFVYTFLFNKKEVVYQYSKASTTKLVAEKLLIEDKTIYEYDFIENNFLETDADFFNNDKIFSIYQDRVFFSLPFLSWCIGNGCVKNNSLFHEIYNYVKNMSLISTRLDLAQINNIDLSNLDVKDLENFFACMGINYSLSLEKLPDGSKELYIVFKNRKVPFLENASSTVLSLFNFYLKVFNKNNSIIYFDEFDNFISFDLCEKLIKYNKDNFKYSRIVFVVNAYNFSSLDYGYSSFISL